MHAHADLTNITQNNKAKAQKQNQAQLSPFVLFQQEPTTFNRGLLLNVGVIEALKFDNYTCFIFHDVDLIPLNDHNLYRCGKNPIHLAVAMNKFKYKYD